MTLPRPRLVLLAALALALPAGAQNPAPGESSIDPIYLSLLKDGLQSYADKQPEEAAKTLRLACFGMLDEPPILTGCLIRLGLAQAGADDREGFIQTFRRLAEVEERFQTYEAASRAVPAEAKEEYERFLVRWIAEEQLAGLAAFDPLSTRRIVAKLKRLPAAEHRKELEQRIADQPTVLAWRVALADLELGLNRLEPAKAQLDAALAQDPAHPPARCLQGLLHEKKGECAGAVAELETCPTLTQQPELAEALISCQLKLGQPAAARATLATLPKEWIDDRRFERLVKQISRQPAATAGEKPAVARNETRGEKPEPRPSPPPDQEPEVEDVPAQEEPKAAPAAPPAAPPPAPSPTLSEEEVRQVAQIRQQVAKVQFAGELEGPLAAASELANARPEAPELQFLAGEIAYRASRFPQAVSFFQRGGDPGDQRAVLLFYWAVSLYESGDHPAAETLLQRALPRLNRTPLVDAYRAKILPAPPEGSPPPVP